MENKKYYIVYKITNKINDMIYIGVHITENVNDKYFGSGTNIKKAIKEFGKENFEKIILENFDTKEKMLEKERELVNEEFIKRGDTYNIILGGGFNTENCIPVIDKNGNTSSVHKTDPRYLSGELVCVNKNMVLVKDTNNSYRTIHKKDTLYLNGELIAINKGRITVKDKLNNTLQVSVDDPRYLSGELISYWQGKKHKPETRLKMSKSMKGKGVGKENSQYGTCWIHNLELKESKKIKKNDLSIWEDKGWLKGRKMKFS